MVIEQNPKKDVAYIIEFGFALDSRLMQYMGCLIIKMSRVKSRLYIPF